ncbi:MAG: hypothetical protein WCB53_01125 [Terriglobales bacterium]
MVSRSVEGSASPGFGIAGSERNAAALSDFRARLDVIARALRDSLGHVFRRLPDKAHVLIRLNVQSLALKQPASSQDYSQIIVQVVRQ